MQKFPKKDQNLVQGVRTTHQVRKVHKFFRENLRIIPGLMSYAYFPVKIWPVMSPFFRPENPGFTT